MRLSPVVMLLREKWRRSRFILIGAFILFVLINWLALPRDQRQFDLYRVNIRFVGYAQACLLGWLAILLSGKGTKKQTELPAHLFVLPVNARQVVLSLQLFPLLVVVCSYAILAKMGYEVAKIIVFPTWLLVLPATTVLLIQALTAPLYRLAPVRLLVSLLLLCFFLLAAADNNTIGYFTPSRSWTAFGLSWAATFCVLVAWFRLERCHEPPPVVRQLRWLEQAIQGMGQWRLMRLGRASTAAAAQLWYELLAGRLFLLPATVFAVFATTLGLAILGTVLLTYAPLNDGLRGISFIGLHFALFGLFFLLLTKLSKALVGDKEFLGKTSQIMDFLALRPLSDGQLAMHKLQANALGTLAWTLSLGAIMLLIIVFLDWLLSGTMRATRSVILHFLRHHVDIRAALTGIAILLSSYALVWSIMGLSLVHRLAQRKWIGVVAVTTVVACFVFLIVRDNYPNNQTLGLVWNVLFGLLATVVIGGTLAGLITVITKRIYPTGFQRAALLLWLGLTGVLIGCELALGAPISKQPWLVAYGATWHMLSLAPLALAPLALRWGRHR